MESGKLRFLPANVLWLSIASFFNDISGEIVSRALPLFLAGTLGISKAFIGIIEGVADSTATLLQLLSGWYSDHWGSRKTVTAVGYGFTAIARPLLYFAGGWLLPLCCKFLDRAGKGIRGAPRDALIADSVSPELRGRAFGFHGALDPLGAVVGAVLVVLLTYHTSLGWVVRISKHEWKVLMASAALPSVLALLIILVFVRQSAPSRAKQPQLVRGSFRIALASRSFRKLLLATTIFNLGLSSDAFLILRASSLGLSIAQIFLMVAAFNAVTTAVSYPAGKLSDRIGRRGIIRAGWITYALLYIGFAFATQPWQVWALYLLYGTYYGLTDGVEKAFVVDLVPQENRGTVFGIYKTAVGLAILPANLVAGILWQWLGAQAPFMFGALMALGAVVLLYRVPEQILVRSE